MQIGDGVAAAADQVYMPARLAVVAGHLVQRVHLGDQTLLAEDLQGLVDGVEGDGGQLPPHLLVNLLGAGVVLAVLKTGQHRQTLRGYGNAVGPQFLDQVIHKLITS